VAIYLRIFLVFLVLVFLLLFLLLSLEVALAKTHIDCTEYAWAENMSYSTTCAEEDNINVPFFSRYGEKV